MRTLLFLLLCMVACYAGAQENGLTFDPGENHNIQGKFHGGIATGDFNEDGLLDVVTMGVTHVVMTPEPFTEVIRTHLHINNGARAFTVTTPFEHLAGGQPIVADFNNDGHDDVFISGYKDNYIFNSENFVSLLYLGNGNGSFTEQEITFPWGSAFLKGYGHDLDNDGNMDIVFQLGDPEGEPYGYHSDSELEVQVVRGNGDGTFSEVSTVLPDFSYGSQYTLHDIAFADVDGNGYDDVLLGGDGYSTKLFLNQGDFIFEEVVEPRRNGSSTTTFPETLGVFYSFGYINDDTLIDLVIADTGGQNKTYFYLNNGDNTFTQSQQFNYSLNSVYFHDFDEDELSELFSGWANAEDYSRLFLNDNGQFSLENSLELYQLSDGQAVAADFDNDGDDDLLYIGIKSMSDYAGASIYWNNLIVMGTSDVTSIHSQIYPNPTRDIVNIVSEQPFDRYEVYNFAGARVSSGILNSQKISLGQVPPGIYIVNLKDQKGNVVSHKVVKQ